MNVYIKTENGVIIGMNAGDYEITSEDWTLVSDSKTPAELFPKGIMTDLGGFNYAYVDGEIVERSAEEIAADEAAANPVQTVTTDDILNTLLGVNA